MTPPPKSPTQKATCRCCGESLIRNGRRYIMCAQSWAKMPGNLKAAFTHPQSLPELRRSAARQLLERLDQLIEQRREDQQLKLGL